MVDSSNLITILTASGGLGIFLIGLITMTNGLHSLAGDKLRSVMLSFTKSAYSGAASGTAMTAILQSSSATTVAAVGFVSAGILTFSQALGIIFGANLGTTITGWLVAIFGFKIKLGIVLLPLILLGAILKLFARKNLAAFGLAIAGFGLIFVGISTMQEAMEGMHGIITPEFLPQDSIIGRLQLILMGVIFTIITQSSSAGVATTLTLLYASAINFHQAAALVIGMDIGTTITAAMATIGGSVNTKRTGFSHVIYNLITAIGAFILITPFVNIWEHYQGDILSNAEIALVAFHTTFNFIGVIAILPFTNGFAKMMKGLIKEDKSSLINALDETLLGDSKLALDVSFKTIQKEFSALLDYLLALVKEPYKSNTNITELQIALDKTHSFVDEIHIKSENKKTWNYLIALIHILDHLQRLHERCEEDENRAKNARESKELKKLVQMLYDTIINIKKLLHEHKWHNAYKKAQEAYESINIEANNYRENIAQKIATGNLTVNEGSSKLEAIRWIRRVSFHLSRITLHLNNAILQSGK